MKEAQTPHRREKRKTALEFGSGTPGTSGAKSPDDRITLPEKCEIDAEDRLDAMAEYLLAYDRYLAGEPITVPELPTLPLPEQASMAPALDCLQLLSQWRATRGRPSNRLADASGADPHRTKTPLHQPFGRFELRRILGQGGFGVVFLAHDPMLGRDVALKMPRPDCMLNEAMRERFLFEGRAAAGLEHPNLVHVLEAGEVNQVCYLAMAYCPGPTLSQWLRTTAAPASPHQAARLIAQLADGVDHAHRRGILHRDLKPANILLDIEAHSDSEPLPTEMLDAAIPKITDFGLARLAERPGDFSRTGVMVGTPQYMAPEQAEGNTRAIGTHTDVHALGLILYEVLTKQRPFSAESEIKALQRVATEEPTNPRNLRKDLPRDLASICMKCLEKLPEKRYATAAALAADLRRFLAGEPVRARTPSSLERSLKWARRRPAVAALLAVSGLALATLIAAAMWHQHAIADQNAQLQKALGDSIKLQKIATSRSDEIAANYYATQIHVVAGLLQDNQVSRMGELLNLLRPKTGEKDYRDFAWHYLWRLARNEQWLRGHVPGVHGLAISKDGKTLASSDMRSVITWDLETGMQRFNLRAENTRPSTVTISPDNQLVAAGNSHTWDEDPMLIRVWNLNTGELVASLHDRAALSGELAFAPDCQSLAIPRRPQATDRDGVLLLWNVRTNQKRYCIDQMSFAMAAAFSPDGETLAVSCGSRTYENQVLAINAKTLAVNGSLLGETLRILSLCYAADGKTLYSWGPDDTLRYWDVASMRERIHFKKENPTVQYLSQSADGRLLVTLAQETSATVNQRIIVRDGTSGIQQGATIALGKTVLFSLAQSPDTKLLVQGTGGNGDGKIILKNATPASPVETIKAHSKEVWTVAFSPDSRTVATGSDDGTAKLWNVADAKALGTPLDHQALVSSLCYSSDGRWLATASYDKKVKLWDSGSMKVHATLEGHTNSLRAVAFAPNGRLLASAGRDKTIRLWDIKTGNSLAILEKHENDVRAVAFSPIDKTLVSVGNDRRAILWDLVTQTPIREAIELDQIWTVAFSPDGSMIVTAGADGIASLWDKHIRGKRPVIGTHQGGVKCAVFSPDGKTLATAGLDKTVRLWHVASGQELICFKGLPEQVNAVAFSPDGRYLAGVLHDGTLKLWKSH